MKFSKTEDRIQQDIVVWFRNSHCLNFHKPRCKIFAVPNGGHRDKREAVNLKATGVERGVSDLIVVILGETLYVEVKTSTGRQSAHQKEFQKIVEALGMEYFLIRSLDGFKKIISKKTP